jgi:hypothetical protein
VLAQPPAEVDLVTTFAYDLIDLPTRMAAATRDPQTLADAYRFAFDPEPSSGLSNHPTPNSTARIPRG